MGTNMVPSQRAVTEIPIAREPGRIKARLAPIKQTTHIENENEPLNPKTTVQLVPM